MARTARVAPEIFSQFPAFRRGIVIARHVENTIANQALENLLTESIGRLRESPVDMQNDPRMTAWNEAYRALGIKPRPPC